MNRNIRSIGVCVALLLVFAAACDGTDDARTGGTATRRASEAIDYAGIGLWDDGPCDETLPPLVIGLMTVFESPVLSLEDQAQSLEAAATAFNSRGGANGSCIKVHTCDDGATVDQSLECVRDIDRAGVVATVNDQGTAGQAEVASAMSKAGIPRVATNVTPSDWADPNAYPLDPSGTGLALLQPMALIEKGVKKIGIVRVDLPAASALVGLLGGIYADQGVTFPFEVPVPAGTTDYSQFILAADSAGVGGVDLATGEQEAIQIARAGQQLDTDLLLGTGLGSFSHAAVADLGDFSKKMTFISPYPPATSDLPVYAALRGDLAAADEAALRPENLKVSPMRSWIGLYALLRMIRDAKMTDFSRAGITAMLQAAKDVPMLGIFGDENWTPNLDHPGAFKRAGTNHFAVYSFDPKSSAPGGLDGNFTEIAEVNFDKVLCGSPLGSPGPC